MLDVQQSKSFDTTKQKPLHPKGAMLLEENNFIENPMSPNADLLPSLEHFKSDTPQPAQRHIVQEIIALDNNSEEHETQKFDIKKMKRATTENLLGLITPEESKCNSQPTS